MSAEHASTTARRPRVCIVQPSAGITSETFLRAHAELLPAQVTVVHGYPPRIDGRAPWSQSPLLRGTGRAVGRLLKRPADELYTRDMVSLFRAIRPDVVLAEYGPIGASIREACTRVRVPLVVHFHGYDATVREVLDANQAGYRALFRDAAAIIAVSRPMQRQLEALGAPADRIHRNPCGVDCSLFAGAAPDTAPPVLLAVGRLVEKKAPHLTIQAFAATHARHPEARLRLVGYGPLMEGCRSLTRTLGLEEAVTFLGPQPPDVVRAEMRAARAFVQHSIQAASGDCEGLPVGILEASASGLPVVATRHAGIPEAVIEGETGILVDEKDVEGMAAGMDVVLEDAALAARMGRLGQAHVRAHFSIEQSIAQLWSVLHGATRMAEG